jgi:hypothetical protein
MIGRIALIVLVAATFAAPTAFAKKKPAHHGHGHHYAHASGKTCKKEFMFLKGKKCADARKIAKA